jgi:hypothetical protein
MPAQFTLPPDTRSVGSGNPPADMNAVVDALTAQGAAFNVLNAAYSGGADPTGVSDCTAAIQAAVNALPASGGSIYFPAGTYRVNSTVTVTQAGACLQGAGKAASVIKYYGSGDCIRMYSTTLTTPDGVYGGGVKGLMIDGTNASAGAAGLHFGDIFRAEFDVGIRDFQGTGSKGAWFDNQYHWAEQITGQVFAEACTSHVVFDNSANTAGTATGSFDRAALDIFLDMKGKGNGVVLQNGVSIHNGQIGIYGNTDYGASLFYVLSLLDNPSLSFTATNASPCVFTASGWYLGNGTPVILAGGSLPTGFTAGATYFIVNVNVGAGTFQLAATSGGAAINSTSTGSGTVKSASYARIVNSVLNIGVECNGTTGTQPGTINFANSGILAACINQCTGVIDFSANNAFAANATNWTSNFLYDGPVYGDSHLMPCSPLGRIPFSVGAITTGGTITTRFNAVTTVAPAGNVTGILMSRDFTGNWREITVVNTSAFTLTFDVPATSFVADGTADVIQANSAATYTWNPNTSLWYRVYAPAPVADPLALAPSGATGETFSRQYGTGGYLASLTSGTVYVSAIPLPAGLLMSNLTLTVGNAAFTSVTHGWYALLDSARVVRAVTADQTGGNWGSTFAAVTLSVAASAYTTAYSGLYYIAFCATFSGSGSFPTVPAVNGGITGLAPILQGTSSTGQTTPPATGATLAAITSVGADRFYAYTS